LAQTDLDIAQFGEGESISQVTPLTLTEDSGLEEQEAYLKVQLKGKPKSSGLDTSAMSDTSQI
jgi:hypothetical protein